MNSAMNNDRSKRKSHTFDRSVSMLEFNEIALIHELQADTLSAIEDFVTGDNDVQLSPSQWPQTSTSSDSSGDGSFLFYDEDDNSNSQEECCLPQDLGQLKSNPIPGLIKVDRPSAPDQQQGQHRIIGTKEKKERGTGIVRRMKKSLSFSNVKSLMKESKQKQTQLSTLCELSEVNETSITPSMPLETDTKAKKKKMHSLLSKKLGMTTKRMNSVDDTVDSSSTTDLDRGMDDEMDRSRHSVFGFDLGDPPLSVTSPSNEDMIDSSANPELDVESEDDMDQSRHSLSGLILDIIDPALNALHLDKELPKTTTPPPPSSHTREAGDDLASSPGSVTDFTCVSTTPKPIITIDTKANFKILANSNVIATGMNPSGRLPPPVVNKNVKSILKKSASLVNLSQNSSLTYSSRSNETELTQTSESTTTTSERTMKRATSFSHINIREYAITLGDNPGGSQGPPISLDWKYTDNVTLPVDVYEKTRPPRRTRREMYMGGGVRTFRLMRERGFSLKEMRKAAKSAENTRKRRQKTAKRERIKIKVGMFLGTKKN